MELGLGLGFEPKKVFTGNSYSQRVPVGGVNSCTGFKFRERERGIFLKSGGGESRYRGDMFNRGTGSAGYWTFFCSN